MAEADDTHVPAPSRIEINGTLAYLPGQPVPWADAQRLYVDGHWPGPEPVPPVKNRTRRGRRAKHGPAEDRARRPSEDR